MPAEIFSLAEMQYTGVFDFAGASRPAPVPSDVVSLIGGTATGGAVVTQPLLWSDLYLQHIFTPSLPRPAYTPTYTLANITSANTTTPSPSPHPSPHKTPIAAIVGGVVGGLIFLALLVILALFLLHRKRKARESAARQNANHAELPSYQDSKDAAAVEAPASGPLEFAPYRPREPAEMAGEEVDRFPTGTEMGDEGGTFSEVGLGSPGLGSPGLRTESRVSEVSDASAHEGRFSRGSGTVSPSLGTGEMPGVVRRKPVGS
jgi:hypothetical protein